MDIDFVLAWVDGGDPEWVRLRNTYCEDSKRINEARFRDWGVLKYWFRAVEAYAPWVRKIHFVTCGQRPDWLNADHPKLHLVDHTDYIPEEYLPTFNSNVIEMNFHRIPGLAEQFVYFNDDMYLNDVVSPTDFFQDGKPCDSAILSQFVPSVLRDDFRHILCNDAAFLNDHFDKHAVMRRDLWKWFSPKYGKFLLKNIYFGIPKGFSAFQNFHIPSAMLRSTYERIWQMEPALLHETSTHKFRSANDVNQYILSYYNICTGNFVPRSASFGKYYTLGDDSAALHADIMEHRHKVICANDNVDLIDFESEQKQLTAAFERVLPIKSTFEK